MGWGEALGKFGDTFAFANLPLLLLCMRRRFLYIVDEWTSSCINQPCWASTATSRYLCS